MGKKKDVSEWLNTSNAEWVEQYIWTHKKTPHVENIIERHVRRPRAPEPPTTKSHLEPVKLSPPGSDPSRLINAIRDLERDLEGREIVTRLKNALRQKKYRSPKNGKSPKTFTLPNSIFRKLQNLAKENGKSHTEIITALLENAELINEKLHKQVKDLKQKLNKAKEAQASNAEIHQFQIDAAMRQLEISIQRLATWETAHGDELPDHPDIAIIKKLADKKIKQAKFAIRYAGQEELISEELSLQESQHNHVRGRTDW